MTLLVITRGLPASGKTTFARGWVTEAPEKRVRVNRDDIRFNLYGVYYGPGINENTVTVAQHAAVEALLRDGTSVVVDDTNLRLAHARAWANMAARVGAGFVVVNMTAGEWECVRRDAERGLRGERSVGANVIHGMAARYAVGKKPLPEVVADTDAAPEARLYDPDPSLPDAWIFDMDGTLALMDGRGPHDYHRVIEDKVNPSVKRLANRLNTDDFIIIVSGRPGGIDVRRATEQWLDKHSVMWDCLYMRDEGDHRNDAIVKAEIFWRHIAPQFNVLGVVDDRDRVVAMWRSMGLTCLQAAPGAF